MKEKSRIKTSGKKAPTGAKKRLLSKIRPVDVVSITPAQRAERLGVLFSQWEAEDALMTPEQVKAAEAKWTEVERGLKESPVNMGTTDFKADA